MESAQLDLRGGTDTLAYAAGNNISVDLQAGTATGFSFIRGVENVTTGAGDDAVRGNLVDNVLDGGAGDDTLRGGFGDDMLIGGDDNDLLYGEAGNDTLRGGEGNDRLDGGLGSDTVSYIDAAAAVTVTLASQAPQDTQGAGIDMLVSIENLTGSIHDDTLTGNGGNNILDGGLGQDAMSGGAGDDTYIVDNAGDTVTELAGGGNDTVHSSLASHTLAGETENLVLIAGAIDGTGNTLDNRLTGNGGNNILDGGLGTDTVVLSGNIEDHDFARAGAIFTVQSVTGGLDTLVSIENVDLGGVVYNMVRGTNAPNTGGAALNGTAGADLLLGFNGGDELHGGEGNDILYGGRGVDFMAGGAGDDTYLVIQGRDFVNELADGGSGIDTIISGVNRNLNYAAHVVGDVENLKLIGAALNGVGNGLDNVITGNANNNTLSGGLGNDTLIGNEGADILNGGGWHDILEGGAGDDTLNGGNGTDTAVFSGPAGNYSFGFNGTALTTVTDMVGTDGTDTLTNIEFVKFGDGPALAISTVAAGIPGVSSIIFGTDGSDTIIGGPGEDVIIGGPGDDILNGSDIGDGDDNTTPGTQDDDIFIWNVGDGFDTINGGMEGVDGDIFQVVGDSAASEIFRIYTFDEAVARIGFTGSDEVEIIVTREVDGVETPIAELTEIEEIVINGAGVSGNGPVGSDTVEMYGNFDLATNLRPNTITIIGSAGNDVIDITSLQSAHRIVFKTGGGQDVIVGTLRPQDVIDLPDGKTIEDYVVVTNPDGSTRIASDTHSVTFFSTGGLPQFASASDGADEAPAGNDDLNDVEELSTPPAGPLAGTILGDILTGTTGGDLIFGLAGTDYIIAGAGADVIRGDEGDDFVYGEAGRDVIFAGEGDDDIFGGDDDDMLYGESGDDWIAGDAGDDLIDAGIGNDQAFGGEGDDLFIGRIGDGNDLYDGGAGSDTLDLGSLSAALQVDLGTGVNGRGSVTGSQSGTDTLYGIENVTTGSGNDVITASNAANVIDGGGGNDVFVFSTEAAADGDTIRNFETGDKIDLSGIDANSSLAGNQTFTLVTGQSATAPGQIVITHETREDGDYTVISGNTGNDNDPEFRVEIAGSRNMTASDFNF
ncbi:calcium-binding protein [Devosia ginsengisoli]|uniref:calcium-binding protein n=1 Tax=Devosia ginsengisoli TaxID=400770 RepID=UPI00164764FA